MNVTIEGSSNSWFQVYRLEARCHRCNGNVRLVSFRRNGDDQPPTWTCASCAGLEAEYYSFIAASYKVGDIEVRHQPSGPRAEPVARAPRAAFDASQRHEKMKPKYMGPRARHDPLR